MRRISFSYPVGAPTTTIDLVWGLEFNAPTWQAEAGSVTKRAQDGTVFSYVKKVPQQRIPLILNMLTEAERDSLIDFVLNIVKGRLRVFRYTDQDSVEHDVRFLDEEFDFGDGQVPYSLPVTLLTV
jgi:hypothetical protein